MKETQFKLVCPNKKGVCSKDIKVCHIIKGRDKQLN